MSELIVVTRSISMVILTIVASALFFATNTSAGVDGAALYKARCSQCHGASGGGKAAMKGTQLQGTTLSTDQIQQLLTQGANGKKAPHSKPISGLTVDQVNALAEYVKSLQ
jgi:mono/diheme cytochrome c family protein